VETHATYQQDAFSFNYLHTPLST